VLDNLFLVDIAKVLQQKLIEYYYSGLNYLDGDKINSLDYLTQMELGYKRKFSKGYLYATLFSAVTSEEGGYEATSNSIIENDYKSTGLELETSYNVNDDFNVRGGLTYILKPK
jgi:outer membrane receptor protein involved in Fe transport